MKFYIDARWVRTDYHDGISRYTAGLLQGMQEAGHDFIALIYDDAQLTMLPQGIRYEKVHHPISWRELFLARTLNARGADVVFSPLQVMGFWGRRYKLILTLQDIIYYKHPKPPTNLAWYVRLVWRLFHMARWPQRVLLDRSDHVVTVSHTSKKFIEQYRLTTKNITVVYNAPTESDTPDHAVRPTKNLVYMGSFMPYKNVETLIDGMHMLDPSYTLHLLSKITPERQRELLSRTTETGRIVFHNGVSDEEYRKLLAASHCLVTATKEEGFGLPLTEAQQLGVPVVCSDLDVLREVAGEGALYFDPDSPAMLAEKVRQLEDETMRRRLIAEGVRHAAQFRWVRSADALYALAADLHSQ